MGAMDIDEAHLGGAKLGDHGAERPRAGVDDEDMSEVAQIMLNLRVRAPGTGRQSRVFGVSGTSVSAALGVMRQGWAQHASGVCGRSSARLCMFAACKACLCAALRKGIAMCRARCVRDSTLRVRSALIRSSVGWHVPFKPGFCWGARTGAGGRPWQERPAQVPGPQPHPEVLPAQGPASPFACLIGPSPLRWTKVPSNMAVRSLLPCCACK